MESLLYNWLTDGSGADYSSYFGVDSDDSSVSWMKQPCYTQMDTSWGASQLYDYYEKWEQFMDDYNNNATFAQEQFYGFQFAEEYVFMEVELEFLNGFYQSVAYTLLLCTATILIFTWNFAFVFDSYPTSFCAIYL